MIRAARAVAALVATLAFAPPVARAEIAVIESHAGERPSDAAPLLAAIGSEFRALGYLAAPDALGARVEARLSRPGTPLSTDEIDDARAAIESGWEAWISGDYGAAIAGLGRGLGALRASPASVVADPTLGDLSVKALVGLALANARAGRAGEAARHILELLRTHPDRPFHRAAFGPEAHDLYKKVKNDVETEPRGSLEIDVDDPDVVIFLNEVYQGVGRVRKTGLYPGRYRVYVRKGSAGGRMHEIDVAGDTERTVSISWALDRALVTGPTFVGLAFDDEAARRRWEPMLAPRIARAIDAAGVVTIGVATHRGARSIVATLRSLDGTTRRTGVVALAGDAPPTERARALARYLDGGKPTDGVIVPDPDVERPRGRGARSAIVLGAGIAALATGVTLIALHQPEIENGTRNPDARDTLVPGAILTGVGAVAIGVGIYLWISDGTAPERTVSIAPTPHGGWAIVIEGRF